MKVLSLQGPCQWTNVAGRIVTLGDTTLLHLSEIERRVLQKVALARLQALNLGVAVRIPSGDYSTCITNRFSQNTEMVEVWNHGLRERKPTIIVTPSMILCGQPGDSCLFAYTRRLH